MKAPIDKQLMTAFSCLKFCDQRFSAMDELTGDFFNRDVDAAAQSLVGTYLFVRGIGGRIVETESYDCIDPASHSFRGPTKANAAMFGPSGHAYIYRSYGIHSCLNFVCRRGSAVLIRAIEPTRGIKKMMGFRNSDDLKKLCAGPGRLCTALNVTGKLNGASLFASPFRLEVRIEEIDLVKGARIGITKAAHEVRRYGIRDSRFLSRPFK